MAPSLQPKRLSNDWIAESAASLGMSKNALIARLLYYGLLPLPARDFPPRPAPLSTYEEAAARIEGIKRAEDGPIDPVCYTRLFSHGRRTERAFILIHGLTNSPLQFVDLARMLHARGHNVYIPLMPFHGKMSHDVRELAILTAEHLRDYADVSVDIAAGLGERVGVVGVSGGANVAMWAGQFRTESVDQSLLVAPFYTAAGVSAYVSRMLANAFAKLPNVAFEDPNEAIRNWVYRGQSSRGIFAVWELIRYVRRYAHYGHAPRGKVGVLLTGADNTSDNRSTYAIVEEWRYAGGDVTTYEFDASLDIAHNSIDPAADPHKRALVHTKMMELLGEPPDLSYTGEPVDDNGERLTFVME